MQTYMILINVDRNDKLNDKESFLERSQRTDTIQSKGKSVLDWATPPSDCTEFRIMSSLHR